MNSSNRLWLYNAFKSKKFGGGGRATEASNRPSLALRVDGIGR